MVRSGCLFSSSIICMKEENNDHGWAGRSGAYTGRDACTPRGVCWSPCTGGHVQCKARRSCIMVHRCYRCAKRLRDVEINALQKGTIFGLMLQCLLFVLHRLWRYVFFVWCAEWEKNIPSPKKEGSTDLLQTQTVRKITQISSFLQSRENLITKTRGFGEKTVL